VITKADLAGAVKDKEKGKMNSGCIPADSMEEKGQGIKYVLKGADVNNPGHCIELNAVEVPSKIIKEEENTVGDKGITDITDRAMDAVDEAVKEIVFEGHKNISEYVRNTIMGILRQAVPREELQYIDFAVEETGDGCVEVCPRNLFTTLLLVGLVVPYAEVRNRRTYTCPVGNQFSYSEDGGILIKPSAPAESIQFSIDMEGRIQ